MSTGAYVLTADGKIATKAEHQGSTFFRTFSLEDGVLTGSRGPNPKVEWKKEPAKKSTKG
jgi:hypothetical protein